MHTYLATAATTLPCSGDGAHTIALGKHDEILDPYTEYVTDTVERDGVAKAMEHYGLI